MPSPLIGVYVAMGGVLVLLVLGLFLKSLWKVPEPNEALIISGFRKHDDTGQPVYRVVIGHGTFVLPIFYQVRRMSLQAMKTDLEVECVTSQGIQVRVLGVVVFKVGDTAADITNAARRFLDQQGTKMADIVYLAFEGHLRSIVGGMTVETLLSDRDALTDNVRAASGADVAKLGLVIDSLTIREIDDPTGYIKNLAAPHIAQAEATARIARAQRGQQAAEAEAAAEANVAEAQRDSRIRQAGAQAEVDKAQAESAQAGPLAEATARQRVTEAQTAAARLAADLKEQQLQTEVRKPADAKAYETRTLAAADREAAILAAQAEAEQAKLVGTAKAEATRATGQAEADVLAARGKAEAAAIKARAEALAEGQGGWGRTGPHRHDRGRTCPGLTTWSARSAGSRAGCGPVRSERCCSPSTAGPWPSSLNRPMRMQTSGRTGSFSSSTTTRPPGRSMSSRILSSRSPVNRWHHRRSDRRNTRHVTLRGLRAHVQRVASGRGPARRPSGAIVVPRTPSSPRGRHPGRTAARHTLAGSHLAPVCRALHAARCEMPVRQTQGQGRDGQRRVVGPRRGEDGTVRHIEVVEIVRFARGVHHRGCRVRA